MGWGMYRKEGGGVPGHGWGDQARAGHRAGDGLQPRRVAGGAAEPGEAGPLPARAALHWPLGGWGRPGWGRRVAGWLAPGGGGNADPRKTRHKKQQQKTQVAFKFLRELPLGRALSTGEDLELVSPPPERFLSSGTL